MFRLSDQVKVLEQCQISPPSNSVPSTTLPLTLFDIPYTICCPIQRIFLYHAPFSVPQFTEEVLPQIKKSLSFALQHYFPLCGNFVYPPQPSEPYILYNSGDSVPFLVAQSTGAFSDFLSDGPKDAKISHQLVPPTPPMRVLNNTLAELTPLLAVQVTLFPNCGLCIGIKFHHVVADGMSFNNFVKTWASIIKAKCDLSSVSITSPVHDKGVIKDPKGIKNVLLDQFRARRSNWSKTAAPTEDCLRATFNMSRSEIERLKKWVSVKCSNTSDLGPYLLFSSYVVTCAFIWICLIKSLDVIKSYISSNDQELCHLVIVADCRNKYNLGIPVTYFGNCLSARVVSLSRSIFTQEDCLSTVAEAVRYGVQSFKDGVFDGYQEAFLKWSQVSESGENIMTVAGSPKLAAYETDFGWGMPAKTEVVHIDISGAVSLSESRNEKGGIEIGICRSKRQMEAFTCFFQQGKNRFS